MILYPNYIKLSLIIYITGKKMLGLKKKAFDDEE